MRGRHRDAKGEEAKHDIRGAIRAIEQRRVSNRGQACTDEEQLENPQSDCNAPVDGCQNRTSHAPSEAEEHRHHRCEQHMRCAAVQGVLDDERLRIGHPALHICTVKDLLHVRHEQHTDRVPSQEGGHRADQRTPHTRDDGQPE